MLVLYIITFSLELLGKAKVSQALISCNETVTSRPQICLVDQPNYKNFWPDWKNGQPMILNTSINLVSIAEFDDDDSTILLNLVVTISWNDTRVTLKSNNPQE